MADIFLSYSSEDRDWASRFAATLTERGWSVFWDRRIPIGSQYNNVIQDELDAAKCIIVVWSATSVASTWVKEEAEEGSRRKVLCPVLIEEVRIPLGLRSFQAANLVDWDLTAPSSEFEQLVVEVEKKVPRRPRRGVRSGAAKPAEAVPRDPAAPPASTKSALFRRPGRVIAVLLSVFTITMAVIRVVASNTREASEAVISLPMGITLRKTTVKASGRSPGPKDRVSVHYVGKLADGTIFDSSRRRGEPTTFPLEGVIRCWTDALQQMKVGETAVLGCPPMTAYGILGHPPAIPANATLEFEVELLGIL